MDRQRVAPILVLALPLLLQAGCNSDEEWEKHFDGPVSVAVLYPEAGGPFEDVVGFVSNSRSGRITPLDLKHDRVLTDDLSASFLRASYVATGRARILGDVAVLAPNLETVTLFVTDAAHGLLVEAPYIVGFDQEPVEVVPTSTEPLFVDADGNGDAPRLEGLELRAGYTTTEQWTVTWDGTAWEVEGSRSGLQEELAEPGEEYHSGYREVQFTIIGTATPGDRFEFSTDTGIVEHDVGGVIQAMSMAPDQSHLLLSIYEPDTDGAALVVFDLAGRVVTGRIPLEEGAQPYRMSWTPDGSLVFVGDARLARAWQVAVDVADPAASVVDSLEMPGPLLDLAYVETERHRRLAVAPVGVNRVDLLDLDDGGFVDVNPYVAGVAGLETSSPVVGLATSPLEQLTPETTEFGARYPSYGIAVSLYEGRLVLLDPDTGCLVPDTLGPRSYESSTDDFSWSDLDPSSTPYLWEDEATGKHVQVNECAGIASSETWEIAFDGVAQAWTVEGSLSGLQHNVAREDERYVSDEGAISFTVMAGVQPSTDGDTFRVTVKDGVLDWDSDLDDDGEVDRSIELPGRPVCFWYDVGPTGGGWDEIDRRAFALVPVTNSDLVFRARLSSGQTETLWD